ncbi:MAG: NlpC/P60 family protein [Peptococcaceae bacterium]|nr:NlpC/P60 family protein [Peptococcaceae bacterium]
MRRKKNLITLCISIICCLGLPLQALAQSPAQTLAMTPTQASSKTQANSLQSQLQQYQQQEIHANSQLNSQLQQESTQTKRILALQQSINAVDEAIANAQEDLAEQQKQLQQLETTQTVLQRQLEQELKKFANLLQTDYEAENGNEIENLLFYSHLLLKSTSFTDFIDRWEDVSCIINYFDQINQHIGSLSQNISHAQTLIKAKIASIQSELQAKKQLQQSQHQLLASQQATLEQINSQAKTTVLAAISAQSNISNSEQQLMQEQTLESSLVTDGRKAGINPSEVVDFAARNSQLKIQAANLLALSGDVQPILSYAEQFLGTPYVWGGTSPKPGFDCSGFVQYVFAQFGIPLERVSQDQYTEGVPIPQSDLKPGDLVFFSTYEPGASHVGIYIGNNIMIDSEAFGVCFDNITNAYWTQRYLGARRMLNYTAPYTSTYVAK